MSNSTVSAITHDEVMHLPHLISHPCSGAGLLNLYLETLLSRPAAFLLNSSTTTEQDRRVTVHDPNRNDFAWVFMPDLGLSQSKSEPSKWGPKIYVYRDPVETLFAMFVSVKRAWSLPEDTLSPARSLRNHLHFYLVQNKPDLVINIRNWQKDQHALAANVAKVIDPEYQFNPELNLPIITSALSQHLANKNRANLHHFMGDTGQDIKSRAGEEFELMHGKRIRDIVCTGELEKFF